MSNKPYIVNYQTLASDKPITTNENWNKCDICNTNMGLNHYEIATKECRQWFCSELCANFWIFQEM